MIRDKKFIIGDIYLDLTLDLALELTPLSSQADLYRVLGVCLRKLQTFLAATNPLQNLPTILFEESFSCERCEHFFCQGTCPRAIPQGTQEGPSQQRLGLPSVREITREFREAEPPHINQSRHESSRANVGPFGSHPGQARIGATDNSGGGKAWRTPSKNPLMTDLDLAAKETLR